jgi:hypothetical protein
MSTKSIRKAGTFVHMNDNSARVLTRLMREAMGDAFQSFTAEVWRGVFQLLRVDGDADSPLPPGHDGDDAALLALVGQAIGSGATCEMDTMFGFRNNLRITAPDGIGIILRAWKPANHATVMGLDFFFPFLTDEDAEEISRGCDQIRELLSAERAVAGAGWWFTSHYEQGA